MFSEVTKFSRLVSPYSKWLKTTVISKHKFPSSSYNVNCHSGNCYYALAAKLLVFSLKKKS